MRLAFLACILAAPACSFAQDSLTVAMLVPERAVKFSPFHLVNFYPTVELSYEHRIKPSATLQLELGYVLDYSTNTSERYSDKRGIKAKLEVRKYFALANKRRRKGFYWAAETYVNIINFDRERTQEECFDLECNHVYFRRYENKARYREQGLSLKIGSIRYFDSRIFIDLNTGVTLRNVDYHTPPAGFRGDVLPVFEIPYESDRVTVGPNLGIRVGYRIR